MKYVVFYTTGEYSDHTIKPFLSFDYSEEAEGHCKELNDRLLEAGLHKSNIVDPFADRYDRGRKFFEDLGISKGYFYVDYTGANFCVVPVPELHDPR